jgi:aspartyl-tRNA(Asn)/glutamyl-tRNA(Gln) amidotransferase subunit A
VAVKELFDVAGAVGCYGSMIFADRVSPADAELVRRLRAAGAIIIGTTRSHEFGWGITTQHERLGSTFNPWALDRVPGGSSGGSAVALATGMVPLAIGSDTGGSIRIPAGFCGVAGLKPTYGRIPKRGGVSLAPSLDHPGPMARSIEDTLDAFTAIAGFDAADVSTIDEPPPSLDAVTKGIDGIRIALAPDLHLTALDTAHSAVFDKVVDLVENGGAELVEVGIPDAAEIRPAFGNIQMAEAFHFHNTTLGTFPDRADEYGDDVRHRLELASEVSIAAYLNAEQVRASARRVFDTALAGVDALLTPVSGGGPSTIASPNRVEHRGDVMPFRDLVMDYTVPQDLVGIPAAVISAGVDADGVPIGVQFTAARHREDLAIQAASGLEHLLGSHERWPQL